MKRKIILLTESKDAKRIHPLSAKELEGVIGGVTAGPIPVPPPGSPPIPGASGPLAPDRDWGWW